MCVLEYLCACMYSSTLAWKTPWIEEAGRLQSMGSQKVGHGWATSLSLFTFMHWRRKWQPTPVFLPGESQGREAWWAAVYGVTQSRTRLKWFSSVCTLNHSFFFFFFDEFYFFWGYTEKFPPQILILNCHRFLQLYLSGLLILL